MLVRYRHIDYDREIALVAIRESRGRKKKSMLGVARLSIETAKPKRASSPSSCATSISVGASAAS